MAENNQPLGGAQIQPGAQPQGQNPLAKHFRQPKIFIQLPSGGKWWPAGSIDMPENGELPVYSMTAKDEMVLKTPDALVNGQSTVTMIQSCIPNIKDAYHIPSIDLDMILIAIRIASYGQKMTVKAKVPNTDIEKDYEVDLVQLMDTLIGRTFPENFTIGDFTFKLRPTNYMAFTQIALKGFEQQRLIQSIQDSKMKDEDKLAQFNQSFSAISNMTVDMIVDQVDGVQFQQEEMVVNKKHIKEFFESVDGEIYDALTKYIEDVRKDTALKPLVVTTEEDERKKGAPETFEVPITFDQSNFFAR
jgi:hypothetical protein|tara:strand:+ start:4046 stop:4954 length:909 start_codon:yes stop_codon:yes gene_type:complete